MMGTLVGVAIILAACALFGASCYYLHESIVDGRWGSAAPMFWGAMFVVALAGNYGGWQVIS